MNRRVTAAITSFALIFSLLTFISIVKAPPAIALTTGSGSGLFAVLRTETITYTTPPPDIKFSDRCGSTILTTVDFVWTSSNMPTGSSCGQLSGTNYQNVTAMITGYILAPVTGTITFKVRSDDGFYMSVNGTNVLSTWSDHGAAPVGSYDATGSMSMVEGNIYPLKAFYHNTSAGSEAHLYWNYETSGDVIIPQSNLGLTASDLGTGCAVGESQFCPADNARQIKNLNGANINGKYWINVGGVSTNTYSLMDSNIDGGGWMLGMKGLTNAQANNNDFGYDATTYWTTTATLRRGSDENSPLKTNQGQTCSAGNGVTCVNGDDANAKNNVFNYMPATEALVIWPDITARNDGYRYTGAGTYGFTWKEPLTTSTGFTNNVTNGVNSSGGCPTTAVTLLALFSNANRCKIRDANSTSPYDARGATIFSYQNDVNFFGFNYYGVNNVKKARFGFGWNENGGAQENSNDVTGGIGIGGSYNPTYGAGDFNGCCATGGINRQAGFEFYVRNSALGLAGSSSSVTANSGTASTPWTVSSYGTSNGATIARYIVKPIGSGVDMSKISINASTGAVSVLSTINAGTYNLSVSLIDTFGQVASSKFTLTVSDAGLSALALSTGTLSPTFAKDTLTYSVNVSAATSMMSVTPSGSAPSSTYKTNVNSAGLSTALWTGTESFTMSLNSGANTILVVVTASNGTTTRTYTLNVIRADAPAAPTGLSTTVGNAQLAIAFTAGANNGSAITNYKYSIDGTNYTAFSPAQSSSPVTITSLTNGTAYTIYLKAVNAAGDSPASASVTATPNVIPTISSAPTISGTTTRGQTLTATSGTWANNPASYTYAWSRATTAAGSYTTISGATSNTYVLAPADIGNFHKVTVIATNSAGSSTASTSAATSAAVIASDPTVLFDSGNSSSYSGSGSTWNDISGNGYNISLSNSPTYSASNGGLINFSGANLQSGATTSSIPALTNFTAQAWFRLTSYPTGERAAIVTTEYGGSGIVGPTIYLSSTGKLDAGFFDGSNWRTAYNNLNTSPPTGTSPLSLNTWYHAAVTWDGSNIKLYLNNSLITTSTTLSGVSSARSAKLRIGARWDGDGSSAYVITGAIPVVKINNRALTSSEISTDYNTYSPRYLVPENTVAPVVSGTMSVGQSLSTTTGTWSNSPTSYTYIWSRADTSGGTYTAISSATSNSYTLTSSDEGKFIKVLVTATNTAGSTQVSSNTSVLTGAALNPTFGSTTSTADGFTVQITNFSGNYNWSGTATASGSVSIGVSGLVTVTGVAPGTSSTATITSTRTNYTNGSGTVSATSTTGAALQPTFGSVTSTSNGYTVSITNYDAAYTWGGSATNGGSISINSSTGLLTVSGIYGGITSVATITTSRTGYSNGSRTVTGSSVTPAVVTNVTASNSNGSYKAGDVITVQITFDKTMTVSTSSGRPYITLETGTTNRQASYSSGSASTTLSFTYTVQSGDSASDLDYVDTSALILNGGTIQDQTSSTNATLTLPSPGSSGSLGANKAIAIDTVTPNAPTSLALATASDTGDSNSDSTTNASNLTITGTAEAGATIKLIKTNPSNTELGSGCTADSNGAFSCQTGTLTSGSYTIVAQAIDAALNASANSSSITVTVDLVAPVYSSAAVSSNGTKLILTYNGSLSSNTALAASFGISAGGASIGISSVAVSSSTVELTLAKKITTGLSVTFTYTDPTAGDDSSAIQDIAGNDVLSLTSTSATNNSTITAPVLVTPTGSALTATAMTAYSLTIGAATSGISPYTYSITGGLAALQSAGLTFNALTRNISGIPTTATSITGIVVTATDSNGVDGSTSPFTITINSGNQLPISIITTYGTGGQSLTLITTGGSGSGAVTYTARNGANTSCFVSGSTLRAETTAAGVSGICYVTVSKAADDAYSITSSLETTIFFTAYIPVITQSTSCPAGTAPAAPTGIGITNCQPIAPTTTLSGQSGAAPKISSLSIYTGLVGASVTITGTGFDTVTRVQFGSKSTTTFTVGAGNTTIVLNVPTGATTGRVMVVSPSGSAIASQIFTVITSDTRAPAYLSGNVNTSATNQITLNFDENLAASGLAASAFAVTVDGTSVNVNSLTISGTTVTLTISVLVTTGKSVIFTYTSPNDSSALQDAVGNKTATITATGVSNTL